MTKLIQCAHCLRQRPPAKRDAVFCQECADRMYARIDAGSARIEAQTPEQRRAESDAIFARIARNKQDVPSVQGRDGRWLR